ncbi:AraC family transcriptional regulator [Gordonia araii NBRC 100433]|nr:helix-turn-helix domain-containing protein [Gordonia araii]NNG99096.1 AraC family transcriptional regulator [Gordonia araii NBRC 100433]
MNLADVQLPVASDGSFGFGDFRCAELTFENAETVVSTLVRLGYIVEDDVVGVAVEQPDAGVSRRSVERHFRQATGLSLGQFRQIDRAREATILLRGGASIVDVVAEAGYYDQAHLARSLRRFIGLTATEIRRGDDQLSLLYKTGR